MDQYFRRVNGVGTGNYIYFWKSKGLSDENITAPNTSDYSLNLQLDYLGTKTGVGFKGCCLKQDKITYTHRKVVNIYIVYELNKIFTTVSLTLANCLFGVVKWKKHSDNDQYKYSRHEIGFDRGFFTFDDGFGKNVKIFGVDISSPTNIDNRKKDILILGKSPIQELDGTTLSAEELCSINFYANNKKYCLSLHYNGANIYLSMVQKLLNLKHKIQRL